MKILGTVLLASFFAFFAGLWDSFMHIYRANTAKDAAQEAYQAEDYQTAVDSYFHLQDVLKETDPTIQLNMAQSYFNKQDTLAIVHYNKILNSPNLTVRSIAHHQLGVLKVAQMNNASQLQGARQGKQKDYLEEAIGHFADAMRAKESNELARYNYELLKRVKEQQQENQEEEKKDDEKKDEENQEQEQNQQKQDQQNQDKQNEEQQENQENQENKEQNEEQKKEEQQKEQEQKSEEQKEKEKMESLAEQLKKMNITPEKAEMLLDAMKNAEKQYLQQNRRKAKKKRDPNKPDW